MKLCTRYNSYFHRLLWYSTALMGIQILSITHFYSASTLVIFLFFSHNYDFLPKKVIKMVRFLEKIMLFGYFRWFNAYFISFIVFQLFFIASNSPSNSLCVMLSCNNGFRNVNIMDWTDRTTSVQSFYLMHCQGKHLVFLVNANSHINCLNFDISVIFKS